jgi:hypothetical protein
VNDRTKSNSKGDRPVEIYAPDGQIGRPTFSLAESPPVLTGLRIGVLENGKPNARFLMQRMAEQVAARTGSTVTLVTDKGPGHNAATPCSDDVFALLAKEVDLVITGSAD